MEITISLPTVHYYWSSEYVNVCKIGQLKRHGLRLSTWSFLLDIWYHFKSLSYKLLYWFLQFIITDTFWNLSTTHVEQLHGTRSCWCHSYLMKVLWYCFPPSFFKHPTHHADLYQDFFNINSSIAMNYCTQRQSLTSHLLTTLDCIHICSGIHCPSVATATHRYRKFTLN